MDKRQLNDFDRELSGVQKDRKDVNYSDKKFYDRFVSAVRVYENGGEASERLGADFKALIHFKKKKLDIMGVGCYSRYSSPPFAEISGERAENGKTSSAILGKSIKRRLFANNKKGRKLKKNENVRLMENAVSVNTEEIEDDERFCCPVCGKGQTLKEMEKGCPDCGESRYITDIFPRVDNCYCKKTAGITLTDIGGIILRWCLVGFAVGIPLGVIRMIIGMPSFLSSETILDSASVAFYTPFQCTAAGFLAAVITILVMLVLDNVKLSPVLAETNRTKVKTEAFMRETDKNFSFEQFESKVIYLVQLMIFCDRNYTLGVCRCKKPPGHFSIIDSVYTGLCRLLDISINGNTCSISLEVTMEDVYSLGEKIRTQRDVFHIRLERSIYACTDYLKQLSDVKCPWCGEYFSALENKNCPHCSEEYDLQKYDWAITEFELKQKNKPHN